MTEFIYFGDHQMFRKLKELYNVSIPKNNSEKKQTFKTKKKTCLENISFMFKENHFQFPPRLNQNNNKNYHGSKSQFGTNVLFEKLKVFKNVIGILTWNGDEFFPSQTLTLFDLNRSESIVHILELTEDEMINEKIVDFQIGDDFIVCQTESSQLYFIGLYVNKSGINYLCEEISCEKFGKAELIKCCSNKILIRSTVGKFYIAEVKKSDQVPPFKPVDQIVSGAVNETVKDVHFGESFTSVLNENNKVFSEGRFIITNDRYGFDWVYPAAANLNLPTSVTNLEKIFGDNHSFMVKDANPNAPKKYYLHNQYWQNINPSLEDWILKYFPEESSITIEDVIANGSGVGYLVKISFGDGSKRIILIGAKGEYCNFNEFMEVLDTTHSDFYTFDFPSYFYSVTGFHKEFSFDKLHFTTNFALFEMKQAQKVNFHSKLYKNSQYSDIEIVSQSEGAELF